MPKKTPVSEPSQEDLATKRAARFALLKRKTAPLLAELETLSGELKTFFRSHPKLNQLGEVGFGIVKRKQLDTAAVRVELGSRIEQFEKLNPVETLFLLRGAR